MNEPISNLLKGYSAEVTINDRKSIDAAVKSMPRGSEVFIAALPSDASEQLIPTAALMSGAALIPVPHIVARNFQSITELDQLLARLTADAKVDRVLLLAGDRDRPAGPLHSSLQLLETGLLQRYGIKHIALAAHPEGHPRVPAADIVAARAAKVLVANQCGMTATFVTQFCFEAAPILSLARLLRSEGVTAPLRVGIAGPASRASLLKYALMCGVGPSLRALKDKHNATRSMMSGETPEELVRELALAQAAEPSLGLSGIHFFTFGSLSSTISWVQQQHKVAMPA